MRNAEAELVKSGKHKSRAGRAGKTPLRNTEAELSEQRKQRKTETEKNRIREKRRRF